MRSNRAFLDSLDWAARADWAAVVAFYTAVHLIELLQSLAGRDSRDHSDRLQYVYARHFSIHRPFSQLYNASLVARYNSNKEFYTRFPGDTVAQLVIGEWLTAVETYVDGIAPGRPPAAGP